jgi:hypothetical protein
MIELTIEADTRYLAMDPQKRPVRFFMFTCPVCGREVALYGTPGAQFSLPTKDPKYPFNVWHIEIRGDRVDISPSIDLSEPQFHHTPQCHYTVTDAPFHWEG